MVQEAGVISRYWKSYGGFKALFTSGYFYVSIVITIFLFPHWLNGEWWEIVLSIMPNVLGFSLGGYAMFLAIGDEKFRKIISGPEDDGEPSPFMEVSSAFVHFIVLQILAIFMAIFADAYNFPLSKDCVLVKEYYEYIRGLSIAGAFLGYFVFIYALSSALSATFAILRVSSWYDHYSGRE
ncbi:hypothetical protein [Aliidiomarina celeris]|uniref:hypothetical protein n=1 Tax=Aliidiomarina celeris TaxID=2249428 RepID=UPI000DEB5A4B|nr:hypothetical protein [Aliidiomarina celeris]